jgi:hypothetical protein
LPRMQLIAAILMIVSAITHTVQASGAPPEADVRAIYAFGGAYAVIGVLLLLRVSFGIWLAAVIPAIPIAFAVLAIAMGQWDFAALAEAPLNLLHLVIDAVVVVLAVLLIRGTPAGSAAGRTDAAASE